MTQQPETASTVFDPASVAEFCRALTLSGHTFTLLLAHCNSPEQQRQFVQQLQTQCAVNLRKVVLPTTAKTLFSTLSTVLGDEQPEALIVFGLESVQDLDSVLISANLVRDEFRKRFACPVVLWVTDEVLCKLVRLAPDFENWASIPIYVAESGSSLVTQIAQDDIKLRRSNV